eukprot:1151165-Pelagomonas_calceolata.AAC.3
MPSMEVLKPGPCWMPGRATRCWLTLLAKLRVCSQERAEAKAWVCLALQVVRPMTTNIGTQHMQMYFDLLNTSERDTTTDDTNPQLWTPAHSPGAWP